jgi:hypothetical protein
MSVSHFVFKCRQCAVTVVECNCPEDHKELHWQDSCGQCAHKFMTEDEKRRQELHDAFAKSRSTKPTAKKPLHPKEPTCPTPSKTDPLSPTKSS